MQCAEAPDQVYAVDAYYFAVGENLGQDAQCRSIFWIVKGWDENEAVGDVEIGVAGRQALATEDDWPGRGEIDDVELFPVQSARRFEAL